MFSLKSSKKFYWVKNFKFENENLLFPRTTNARFLMEIKPHFYRFFFLTLFKIKTTSKLYSSNIFLIKEAISTIKTHPAPYRHKFIHVIAANLEN